MKDHKLSDLERSVTDIKAAGDAWIEAKLRADQLEEDCKNFLAELMNELEHKADDKISESKLERLARGSKAYRDYVAGMCAARAEASKKRIRYDALQSLFEAKRSDQSLEREKISKGIFNLGG